MKKNSKGIMIKDTLTISFMGMTTGFGMFWIYILVGFNVWFTILIALLTSSVMGSYLMLGLLKGGEK